MLGTDRNTGKALSGLSHLRQSITDILSTPYGSRIGRRTYGSRLFSLIDAPLTAATLNDIYQAAAEAIINWEPRITVSKIKVKSAGIGKVSIDVIGTYTPTRENVTISTTITTQPGETIVPVSYSVEVDGLSAFTSADPFPIVNFGTLSNVGQKSFVLTNTSTAPMVVRSISADGPIFGVDNIAPVLPLKLAPGESVSFDVWCVNAEISDSFSTLRIGITASGSTYSFTAGLSATFVGVDLRWIAYDSLNSYADGALDAPSESLGWAGSGQTMRYLLTWSRDGFDSYADGALDAPASGSDWAEAGQTTYYVNT